jgi:hypothetical protein
MNIDLPINQSAEEARPRQRRSLEDFKSDWDDDEELQSSQDKRRRLKREYISSPLSSTYTELATRIDRADLRTAKEACRNARRPNSVPPLYVLAILNRMYLKSKNTRRLPWHQDDAFETYINDVLMKVRLLSAWYQEFSHRPDQSNTATIPANADSMFPATESVSHIHSPSAMMALAGQAARNAPSLTSRQPSSRLVERTNADRYEIFDNEDGYFDSESESHSDIEEDEEEDEDDDGGGGIDDTRRNYRRNKAMVYSDFNKIQL